MIRVALLLFVGWFAQQRAGSRDDVANHVQIRTAAVHKRTVWLIATKAKSEGRVH